MARRTYALGCRCPYCSNANTEARFWARRANRRATPRRHRGDHSGRVMSSDTLRRTAADSFEDFGAYLVSVEAVVDGSSATDTCRDSPRIGDRYNKVRLSTAGRLDRQL